MRLDAIGIVTRDLGRALGFYRLLGVEFPAGAEGEGHVEATLQGGVRLLIDTEDVVRSFDPSYERPSGRGPAGLAFLCGSPEAVDETHGRVVAAGFGSHLAPFDAFWGQRYATVIDPDGTHVDLFAPLD